MTSILVIDDDQVAREYIGLCLQRAGYSVACAADGRQALDALDNGSIDLVITDIFMPECDGIEVIRALRNRHPGVRSLAISGGSGVLNTCYLPAAQRLGADRILAKPFSPDRLLSVVEGLLAADAEAPGRCAGGPADSSAVSSRSA